jgi:hypothetical protein
MRRALALSLVLVLALAPLAFAQPAGAADDRERAIVAAASLSEDELDRALDDSPWRDDPLFLAAVAQNPKATAEILDEIAGRDDPRLHEKLVGSRALLGRNWQGLAVMRLIALHPNVAEVTLVRLAESRNDYVVSTVLGNAKTPESVLRRYAGRDNYLYDWGIAANPLAPAEMLVPLATSGNEYTRSRVAANPQTPVDVLERLVGDTEWHVRRGVAMNPATPKVLVVKLASDADVRVRRSAESVLRARGGPPR